MSMPKLPEPNPDLTQEQALTMILSSIALEEAALAHILNAEGEKIQYMLNKARCGDYAAGISDVLEVNKSVTGLLEMVQQNQTILKSKMEKVLEYLPKQLPRPKPPCPPVQDGGAPDGMPTCFCVIPKAYRCDEPLLWTEKNICGGTITCPSDSSKIRLPSAEPLLLGFYAKTSGAAGNADVLELAIVCKGIHPIRLKIAPGEWDCRQGFYRKIIVEMPRFCTDCHASVFVRAPQGMHINQGGLFYTRFQAEVLKTAETESV